MYETQIKVTAMLWVVGFCQKIDLSPTHSYTIGLLLTLGDVIAIATKKHWIFIILGQIITVTSVRKIGETGDINGGQLDVLLRIANVL